MGNIRPGVGSLKTAYAVGSTTATAVTRDYLARISRIDPPLRAFIEIDEAGALRAAAESDARIAAGRLRELEGIPIGIKANLAVAGLEWNAGMQCRRGIVAQTDAASVSLLRAAGAIILGTLNMHEAAFGATTDNPWFGRAMNPHRPGHTPGGSSGGSGAAVAADLCVAALGSDTLGSIRIPASYNGIYGLKPTHGAVPTDGLVPLAPALDTIGPLARSLDDLEALTRVLLSEPARLRSAAASPLRRVLTLENIADEPCAAPILAACDRAHTTLSGFSRLSIRLPHALTNVRLAGFRITGKALAAQPEMIAWRRDGSLSPELTKLLDIATERPASGVAADLEVLAETGAAVRSALGGDGVLLLPTTPQVAFAHTARPPASQAVFTTLASAAGLPAISLPAGCDADRLPVGIQLVGPIGSDMALIALARAIDDHLAGYTPPLLD
jgi:aspartyl-tRNA(Asn)/glutamyl-tRNA(Gln) amidotransferase subunit A